MSAMYKINLKNALYLSVNVFSTKETLYFKTSPTGDRTTVLCRHPSHEKVWPFAGQR